MSAVLTSTVKPPSTALSKLTVTVIAPLSSFPLTSAIVKEALSSFSTVKVAVSVMSILLALTVLKLTFCMLMVKVSSASTLLSPKPPKFKVCVSPAVPAKVNVEPAVVV